MRVSLLLPLALLCLLSLAPSPTLSVAATPRHSHERLRGAGGAQPAHGPMALPLLDVDVGAAATPVTAAAVGAPDPRYKDHVADAWIAREAVVAFNESVSAQHKEDWLNSLLYAQLVCRQFSGFTQLAAFAECVPRILWSGAQWPWHAQESPQALARGDVEQPLAEDVLSKANGKQGGYAFPTAWQRLARAAVESLKVEDIAYDAFHNFSTNATSNFFLLSLASETPQGDMLAWSIVYQVTTTAQGYQVLWATYPKGAASLQAAAFSNEQNPFQWTDQYRQDLKDALVNFLPKAIYSKPIKL